MISQRSYIYILQRHLQIVTCQCANDCVVTQSREKERKTTEEKRKRKKRKSKRVDFNERSVVNLKPISEIVFRK